MADDGGWCVCDFDYAEVEGVRERRARKRRRCDECHGPIEPGDTYRYLTWKYGEGWSDFSCCAACCAGPIAFCLRNCGCVLYGGVEDHLTDVFREYEFTTPGVRFRLGRMLVEMRRRREAWGPSWAVDPRARA